MKIYRNPLYRATSYALGAGALTAMTAAPAFAQDQDDEDEAALERIQVTGSRIQSEVVTASAPVAEIDAEEFNVTGTTRVEDLLNQYPQMSAIGANTAFTVNPTAGFPTVDLRDMGPNRTLVLVNGHRLPPGGIRSQARDLNTVPTGLIKRVEILTGGASAVYGSDAMAGVVNFILDTDFTGFSASAGYSAFQHDNDNKYMQGLQEEAGFDFPSGSSGLDGKSRFAELIYGSHFDDGRGHAMSWVTYRDHEELRQNARDYSSCALNASGEFCGGSATAADPSFSQNYSLMDANGNPIIPFEQDEDGNWVPGNQLILGADTVLNPDSSWALGENLYNFAPPNHFQRPDETWTFGTSIKYEVNDYFRPYMDGMLSSYTSSAQIAESGTFFAHPDLVLSCDNPLLGSFCDDLGFHGDVTIPDANGNEIVVPAFIDPSQPVLVSVGKRNVEGGPRRSSFDVTNFRIVTGAEGDLGPNWSYDVSFLFGRNNSSEISENDFLSANVVNALLACEDPELRDTPACYNVWEPGGVTPEAAADLAGTGIRTANNTMMVGNAYVTGDLGFGLPSAAGQNIQVVAGGEWRQEEYVRKVDTNWENGAFLGGGGPRLPVSGAIEVVEGFTEALVPVLADMGWLNSLNLDLGYRISDYDTTGIAHTWKIGFHANFADRFRVRGGWNRAIRSPNTDELFRDQQIQLFSGSDPCAGENPALSLEQCARTGVSAAQYGNIPDSPASQYNQFAGGNPDLDPEEADTYTLGVVFTPISGLEVAVDYWDIRMTDRIGGIGANTVLQFCALTGDPLLCGRVNRNPVTGDLWRGSDPETSGFVENLDDNFGDFNFSGVDLNANYRFNLGPGMAHTSFVGSYLLEQEIAPLPGLNPDATFDCAGRINTSCGNVPRWRHIASFGYSQNRWSVTARWRYIDSLSYKGTDDSLLTDDQLLVDAGNKIGSHSFWDLSGSVQLTENLGLTAGVNNIFDKEPPLVGGTLSLNANSLGGYDQLGRYIHGRITLDF